jgi:hypothetical protein
VWLTAASGATTVPAIAPSVLAEPVAPVEVAG